MKKTLILGATGFIGYHITKLLLKKGYEIKIMIHNPKKQNLFNPHEVELVNGDIQDIESLRRAIHGCDKVYHVAGIVSFNYSFKEMIYRINVDGTENVCKVVMESDIEKFVYTSSAASIGKNKKGLSDENTVFNLWNISSDYKKSKVLAENKVLEYYQKHHLPVVILNPSLPVGTHDFRPSPSGIMIVNYLKNSLISYVEGGMNFIDVEDVAEGHYLAERQGRMGERYILGHENLKIKEFYAILDKLTASKKKKLRLPYRVGLLAGELSQMAARKNNTEPVIPKEGVKLVRKTMFYDVSKATNELGMNFHPVSDACVKAIEWFQKENYIK